MNNMVEYALKHTMGFLSFTNYCCSYYVTVRHWTSIFYIIVSLRKGETDTGPQKAAVLSDIRTLLIKVKYSDICFHV